MLDLIHFDVLSPIKIPSISKDLYYASFISDYSRKTWVYFLKTKYNIFGRFKEFKALLKIHTGRKIKLSNTNNGDELCSTKFDKFCNDLEWIINIIYHLSWYFLGGKIGGIGLQGLLTIHLASVVNSCVMNRCIIRCSCCQRLCFYRACSTPTLIFVIGISGVG
jgi:hypothetical protein